MNLECYILFAFSLPGEPFTGNPAAVVLLDAHEPISPGTMSAIAKTLGQPETIYARQRSLHNWEVKWYTGAGAELCPGGNGTVALAHVLGLRDPGSRSIIVASNCRWISSDSHLDETGSVRLSLASIEPRRISPWFISLLVRGLGANPVAVFEGERDLIAVFENEQTISSLQPNLDILCQIPYFAIDATAPGVQEKLNALGETTTQGGFVYRTFIPSERRESQGSGASLMNLVAYWSPVYPTQDLLIARQLHENGGRVLCRLDRINGVTWVTAKCEIFAGPFTVTCEKEDLEPELVWE